MASWSRTKRDTKLRHTPSAWILYVENSDLSRGMHENIFWRIRLPEEVRNAIVGLEQRTAANTGMTMVIALSYSARWEITEAVKKMARQAVAGEINVDDICEDDITEFMPDPDLLIRTGGEVRLSNYLLWQCAYSELYFCDTFWPDFHEADFMKAIDTYCNRERRYGKTSEQVQQ